jgi:hypothetical protein
MSDTDNATNGESSRIEKSGVAPVDSLELGGLIHELELLAVDSIPKLDTETVRIEKIEVLDNGMRQTTISGEKSEFCPTYGDDNE